MEQAEVFADGLGNIQVAGGVVRLDLVSFSHSDQPPEKGPPNLVLRQRIIMPLEGFLRSFSMQEEVMRKLIHSGVVSKPPESSSKN